MGTILPGTGHPHEPGSTRGVGTGGKSQTHIPGTSGQGIPSAALRVALGRHGLALVARHLRTRGIHQVALPDYHCLTMLTPFQLEGMHIAHVRTGPGLLADPEDLARTIGPDPSTWAVLHCETFGAAPTHDLSEVLSGARRAGATLIVDATHTWPEAPHVRGDHVVASIRKLASLPDGAFVTGLDRDLIPDLTRSPTEEAETRAWLRGDLDAAEDLMDAEPSPVAMSPQSSRILSGLELGAIVASRRRRARSLSRGLQELGLEVLSPPDAHFCLAFRHPRGPELVLALARVGVDGPVWWPRPSGWSREWPDDVVTLPLTDCGDGLGGEPGCVGAGDRLRSPITAPTCATPTCATSAGPGHAGDKAGGDTPGPVLDLLRRALELL